MTQDIAIDVQGLSLSYEHDRVLKDVDLAIPRGAVVGLAGRNGAGKSTLLRCLVGLSAPQEGQARLLGESALELGDATREQLGYVGQEPDLLTWLTVWDHVRYIGSFYKNFSEHRARDLLIRLGLAEGRRVSQLSVGDAQKLSIVLAMAHDPAVLIMDEPVASLDPMTRREFLRTLFESNNSERTVVLSSHLLGDLERVATHLCFLREGRVQWFGERDALPERLGWIYPSDALRPQPGLVFQRRMQHGWRALVDRGAYNDAGARIEPMDTGLEDLFVEVNS